MKVWVPIKEGGGKNGSQIVASPFALTYTAEIRYFDDRSVSHSVGRSVNFRVMGGCIFIFMDIPNCCPLTW